MSDPKNPTMPAMRLLLTVAAILVLIIGVPLYFVPTSTPLLFSWTVNPPITAAFLGSGYLAAFQAASGPSACLEAGDVDNLVGQGCLAVKGDGHVLAFAENMVAKAVNAFIVALFFRWTASKDPGTQLRRVVLDDEGRVVSVADLDALPEVDEPETSEAGAHSG